MSDTNKHRYRIVFLGGSKVGKTCLIKSFLGESLPSKYRPTVEDLFIKHIHIQQTDFTLELLDTAGYCEFPAMRELSIQKADALVLVYSVTDPSSTEEIQRLFDQVCSWRGLEAPLNNFLPTVIVRNKVDLECNTAFDTDEAEILSVFHDWRQQHCIPEVEASCLETPGNVKDIFFKLLQITKLEELQKLKNHVYDIQTNSRRPSEPSDASAPQLTKMLKFNPNLPGLHENGGVRRSQSKNDGRKSVTPTNRRKSIAETVLPKSINRRLSLAGIIKTPEDELNRCCIS